jgi:hypothetical protein
MPCLIDVSSKAIQKARRMAKRVRATIACARCKASKIKCSEYRPCKTCEHAGAICKDTTFELHQRLASETASQTVSNELQTAADRVCPGQPFFQAPSLRNPQDPLCQSLPAMQIHSDPLPPFVGSGNLQAMAVSYHPSIFPAPVLPSSVTALLHQAASLPSQQMSLQSATALQLLLALTARQFFT